VYSHRSDSSITALITPQILLCPYSEHHVPTYHEWMKDEVSQKENIKITSISSHHSLALSQPFLLFPRMKKKEPYAQTKKKPNFKKKKIIPTPMPSLKKTGTSSPHSLRPPNSPRRTRHAKILAHRCRQINLYNLPRITRPYICTDEGIKCNSKNTSHLEGRGI
jgi:hypothetical protein